MSAALTIADHLLISGVMNAANSPGELTLVLTPTSFRV
jgi:hypothetical protein